MSNDILRTRIRLALGGDMIIGDRLSSSAGVQRYSAMRGRESALVTVFPRAPLGPTPEALRSMVDRFRAAQHASLSMPTRAIEVDGRAVLVSQRVDAPTVHDRLESGAPFTVRETVVLLRELARGLATLHRRGLAHGALSIDTVHLTPAGVVVSGLGTSTHGSPAADLMALGQIGYAMLAGELPGDPASPLSARRRAVPAELQRVIDSLLHHDAARRPTRAESVLNALDLVHARRPVAVPSFLDGAGRGARFPHAASIRVAVAAIGILLVAILLGGR